jgi:hypothetical protein
MRSPIGRTRNTSRRLAAVLVMTACLVAVWGSGGSIAGASSLISRVSATTKQLRRGLVDVAAVAGIPGFERLRPISAKDQPRFVDPDPRGPCGARIKSLNLSKGASAVFVGPGLTVSDTIVGVSERRARAFMDANLADAQPGCAPYDSMADQTTTQHVEPTIVALPAVGDQRFGEVGRIESGGRTVYYAAVSVRRAAHVAVGLAIGAAPIKADSLQSYATVIDDHLRHLA